LKELCRWKLQSIPKEKRGNETTYLEKDGWTSKTIEKPELSKPISILNLVKYSKQAYYNGNPEYYDLPTSEQSFILGYAKNATKTPKTTSWKLCDSTGQVARTTFMRYRYWQHGSNWDLWTKINKIFPSDRYEVIMTGKALVLKKERNTYLTTY
jgi:hypothetical protein